MNEEYCKVIREFIPDFLSTFPEYEDTLDKGILDIIHKVDSEDSLIVYKHSVKYVAHHIIRILQQDQTLFEKLDTEDDTYSSTEYIKGIVFAELWYKDITEQTKDILWKYLQLMAMSIVNYEKDQSLFTDEDIASLFQNIDEGEFKTKLEETLNNMKDFFDSKDGSDISFNEEDTKKNLDKIMNGKIGSLAKEIAKETLGQFGGEESEENMLNTLMKNPLGLIKNIEKTLEEKVQNGEINKAELMEEAKGLMSEISNMDVPGGMGPLQDIMKQFQGATSGSGAKSNMNNLNKNMFQQYMNSEKRRSDMRTKLDRRRQEKTNEVFTINDEPVLRTPAKQIEENKNDESNKDDWNIQVNPIPKSKGNGKGNGNKKKKKKKKNKNV